MRRLVCGIMWLAGLAGPVHRLSAQFPGQEGPDGERTGAPPPADASRTLPDAGQLDGPPAPERAAELFGLDSSQAGRYRIRWDSLQARTLPLRNAARKQLETVQRAEQAGYVEVAGQQRALLDRQAADLRKEDRRFEKSLHDFFSRDQQKAYERWRKGLESSAPGERGNEGSGPPGRHSRAGGASPPAGSPSS